MILNACRWLLTPLSGNARRGMGRGRALPASGSRRAPHPVVAIESLEARVLLEGVVAPQQVGPPVFTEPPVIASVQRVLTATLTQAQGPAVIGGRPVTNAWMYNGQYVGPTLWANPGDLLDLTIVNDLPDGIITNLHTHGLHVSPLGNSDNVLLQILPGENNHYQIQIPPDHPEGLYWYHPHHHTQVDQQISLGLSGLLVIGRPDGGATQLDGLTQNLLALKNALLIGDQIVEPSQAPPFSVTGPGMTHATTTLDGLAPSLVAQLVPGMSVASSGTDLPSGTTIASISGPTSVLLSNAATASQSNVYTFSGSNHGEQTFTVNGLLNPVLTMQPGEWRVLNIANIGNDTFYNLKLIDSARPSGTIPWLAVARDGNPFTTLGNPQQEANFLIGAAPGMRWSVLIQAPVNPLPNESYTLVTIGWSSKRNLDPTNTWPARPLMTIKFSGPAWTPPPKFIPAGSSARTTVLEANRATTTRNRARHLTRTIPVPHRLWANHCRKRIAYKSASFMTNRNRTGFPAMARTSEPFLQSTTPSISSPNISGQSSRAKPGTGFPSTSWTSTRNPPAADVA
ncbi:MAG: multicopper oxidase domain-containing protein [Planctomycetales bacterium]